MSVDYKPMNFLQRVLASLESIPNPIGRSARRKLRRRYAPRAYADFDRHLARLGPGDVVLDLGANVGEFTRRLAATGAQVHAFEPDPDTFAILRSNVGRLPNVTLHQVAVGQAGGTAQLHRGHLQQGADGRMARKSVISSIIFSNPKDFAADTVDVEVRPFAEVLRSIGRPVALIKMDIEGAEFEILRDIFRAPEDQPFDALFVETHESIAPEQVEEIDRMRAAAAAIARPHINLYWP